MKKTLLIIALLIFALSACSTNYSDIEPEKINYLTSIINCDSGTNDFDILNKGEVAEFFSNIDPGSIYIQYKYKDKEREIMISRIVINNNPLYVSLFSKYVFPLSKCSKIKSKTVTLE
jgi:hypothetical protein